MENGYPFELILYGQTVFFCFLKIRGMYYSYEIQVIHNKYILTESGISKRKELN